jgi:plasmid stability protein
MAEILIPDLDDKVLTRLRQRAAVHGRTAEAEARVILQEVLQQRPADAWAGAEAIREGLAASGRSFSDSADLLREDRDR